MQYCCHRCNFLLKLINDWIVQICKTRVFKLLYNENAFSKTCEIEGEIRGYFVLFSL